MHTRSLRAALYASLLTASCALKLSAVDAGVASVAKLRPSDNKDAFFTAAPRFYGVFDGVSQCPESRIYAQTLAKETSAALKRSGDAGGSWSDQAQAALLQAAQAADRYSGSSTAIMMRLDLDQPQPQVCTFALGDSSALVLKYQPDGSYAVGDTSGVMYHDNGAPDQLALALALTLALTLALALALALTPTRRAVPARRRRVEERRRGRRAGGDLRRRGRRLHPLLL